MNADLSTYSLADFIPFTADVYQQLFRNYNEEWWPVQLFGLAIGAAVIWAGRSRTFGARSQLIGVFLGAVWAWIGYAWYLGVYADLNWAGTYIAGACFVQAFLLVAMGLAGRLDREPGRKMTEFTSEVALFGLVAYACYAFLSGREWADSLVFGHDPQATAVVTLGMVLMVARPAWLLMIVPLVICILSGVTAHVLGFFVGYVTLGLGALAIVGGIIAWFARRG